VVNAVERRIKLIRAGPHEDTHLQLESSRVGRASSDVHRGAVIAREHELEGVSEAGWPSPDDADRPSEPQVEIAGDHINPRLRLFYGSPRAPVVELTPPNLLNSVLYEQA
jgi:hypothetical protein